MQASIKIKKNVRKLRIEDPPARITEQTSQATNSPKKALSVKNEQQATKTNTQSMPALDQNLPQSLRGLATKTNQQIIMRQSHQNFQPASSLEGTVRQSIYLKSLKTDKHMSPLGQKAKLSEARLTDYVTQAQIQKSNGARQAQRNPEGSLERPSNHSTKLAVGQLRLKPSQILQDAKNDVQFGNRPLVNESSTIQREGGSSLAVLCSYLQPSQSQPSFQPMAKKTSILGSTTQMATSNSNMQNQEKIAAVINERFIYKENSRFKKNRDASMSRITKALEEANHTSKMAPNNQESLMTTKQEISASKQLTNFQSINTDNAHQQSSGHKMFKKYQNQFKSPIPSNYHLTSSQQQSQQQQHSISKQQRLSISNKGGLLNNNAYNSIQSTNSQANMPTYQQLQLQSSNQRPHQIQTMSKETDQPATYIPFLKQTPLVSGKMRQNMIQDDLTAGSHHLNAYPSHKVFATGEITKNLHKDTANQSQGSGGNDKTPEKLKQEYMPYQIQLMSLKNVGGANNGLEESARNSTQPVNMIKVKQDRIIQRLERQSKKDQMIVAPQGMGMPSLIKKSRNPKGVHSMGGGQALQKSSMNNTRTGSAGPSRKGSWDQIGKGGQIDPAIYKEAATTLGELPDPVDQVKLLPLKARLIFKKAMKELDSVDLVNTEQLPMSRPRIRAILKKMKDNLEQGTYSEDKNDSTKDKPYTPTNDRLMEAYGRQAERELFGMLIKEKKEKKLNRERNQEMRQLYEDRMLRKKMQFEQMQEKQEMRQKIKDDNGYLSESSSDMANSFEANDQQKQQKQQKQQERNESSLQTERQQQKDFVTTLLGSERPSSAEQLFASVTSRKDTEQYNRMRSQSNKRQKKQAEMVLEELLTLIEKPKMNASPAAGNFYSKFQNLDKIIQQEDNEQTENVLQELHEMKELAEEERMKKIVEAHERGESPIMYPVKKDTPAYLTNEDFVSLKKDKTFFRTPGKPMQKSIEKVGKSPIVEYLKQAQKDNLLPHFMPFKKLQEATNQPMDGGQGLKYCLDQFSINVRNAPSIASAIMNLQQLHSMSLVNTMLNEESFMILLNATPKTLVSLNLSENEHLSPKCYSQLHSLGSLAHLSLEKCNIRDETIAILFDLDPHKLNAPAEPTTPEKSQLKKTLKKQLSTNHQEDEESAPAFILSGLLKTIKLFNVSKNQITDAGAKMISSFIDKSETLETLQLHWNKIRAKGAMSLAKSIKTNRTIQILDLSFNSFGSGSIKKAILSDDLKKEEEVHVEQRHPMNKLECAVSAWKWRKTLMKNLTLLHVDISFNGFTDQDMIAIGDGLRENHTLLGCHVEGNNCKMDSLGFIMPILTVKPTTGAKSKQMGKQVYDVHKYDRIPISMENIHLGGNDERKPARGEDQQLSPFLPPGFGKVEPRNCWLCEGWSQMLFEVRLPDKFIGCEVSSVYVHLSYEDYQPMVMQEKIEQVKEDMSKNKSTKLRRNNKNEGLFANQNSKTPNGKPGLTPVLEGESVKPKAQVFQLYRMVPPSKKGIKFYYSMQNPKNFRKETFIDQYKKKIFVEEDQSSLRQSQIGHDTDADEDQELVVPFPKFVNQTRAIQSETMSLSTQSRVLLKAMPRCAFNTQERSRPKSPWSIPKSFFGKYKHDNDLIIGKCFDFDWRCSTLEKMIKDPHEKEQIIKYLRPKYGLIRETYKHLACVAPAGNMPSLGMNILTEMMLKCNEFVDYKNTKLSDVDLAFIATNAVGAKNFPFKQEVIINPERQIIRYQFFEILIRLATERFTQKQKMSYSEGIKVFLEQFIQDTFQKYQSHPWRLERYWNEDCDNVIKDNMDTLKDFFNVFALPLSPGEPKVIRLTRLIEMITISGVCDDNFGAREIGPLYNLAMQTNMDEINKTRHMDMQFIEFIEALARIADKAVSSNFVEFPVDRSQQQQQNNKPNQNTVKKNKNQASPIQSLQGSRENLHAGKSRSPSPVVFHAQQQSQQQTERHSEAVNSVLVIDHRSSGEPSILRESIQPIRITDGSNPDNENARSSEQIIPTLVSTPKKLDENNTLQGDNSFNMDIQADLTPVNKSGIDINAKNLALISPAKQGEAQHVASFVSSRENWSKRKKDLNQSVGKRQINNASNRVKFGRKGTTHSVSSAVRSHASQSKSRGFNSDYDQSSINGTSAFEGEIHLSEKLMKYINRIAVTCMGQQYAQKYVREYNKRNARNARRQFNADADLLAQAELLGQIGFKATLQKLRYSNQKPPPQPDADKRGGGNKNRTSVKIR